MSPAPIPPINANPGNNHGNNPGNDPGKSSGNDAGAGCGNEPAASGVPSHADRPGPATVAVRVDAGAARAAMASALAQGRHLAREVDRLSGLLAAERMRYANLWAAVRAAVYAGEDGEADPLTYLMTECPGLFTRPWDDPRDQAATIPDHEPGTPGAARGWS